MKRSAPLQPGKPLQRKTPLKASAKRMKSGRSTGTPTKAEAARIVAVKEGPCIACLVRLGELFYGCDAHHLLSGGRRIGHMATIGLCAWHHRAYTVEPPKITRDYLGPSLMDGSKRFHEVYGSDAELLELQNQLLGENGNG